MAHLFVYGTLLPGEVRWQHLEPFVDGEGHPDSVDGDLFDTGVGYPAARFAPGATIVGHTFPLRLDTLDEALALLDEIEGAVAGLYARRQLTSHCGVSVWAYEYGGGLELAPIATGSWLQR